MRAQDQIKVEGGEGHRLDHSGWKFPKTVPHVLPLVLLYVVDSVQASNLLRIAGAGGAGGAGGLRGQHGKADTRQRRSGTILLPA